MVGDILDCGALPEQRSEKKKKDCAARVEAAAGRGSKDCCVGFCCCYWLVSLGGQSLGARARDRCADGLPVVVMMVLVAVSLFGKRPKKDGGVARARGSVCHLVVSTSDGQPARV